MLLEIRWVSPTWTDETQYLRSYSVRRGFPDDDVSYIRSMIAEAGTARFVLDNSDLHFAGAVPGARVRFSHDGVYLFKGVISHVLPDAGEYLNKQIVIECVDGMGILQQNFISVAYDPEITVYQGVQALVDEVEADITITPAYEVGVDELGNFGKFWSADRTTVYSAIEQVCRSWFARFYHSPRGGVADGLGIYYLKSKADYQRDDSSPVSVLDASVSAVSFESGYYLAQIVNRCLATYYPPDVVGATVVLWQSQGYFVINAGYTEVFRVYFRDPQTAERVTAHEIIAVTATTDYVINSEPDGSGVDLTALVTVGFVAESTSGVWTIENTTSYSAHIISAQVRGKILTQFDAVSYEARDETSIDAYGMHTMSIEVRMPPAVSDATYVRYYADFVVAMIKDPLFIPRSLTVERDYGLSPYDVDLYDVVSVVEAQSGVDRLGRVMGISYWRDEGGRDLVNFRMEPFQDYTYFATHNGTANSPRSKIGVGNRLMF